MTYSLIVTLWALLALAFTIVAIGSTRQLFTRAREAARRPRLWPHIALVRPCEGLDPSLVAADGFHPSTAGHRAVAGAFAAALANPPAGR